VSDLAAPHDSFAHTLGDAIVAAETGPLPARPGLSRLLRFAAIGSLGFVWDTATTYATRPLIGLLPAAMLAFVVAASLNWLANRLWTFRDCRCAGGVLRQWALYMAANSLGFLLNRGTFAALVLAVPACRAHPVIALAAGAVAGLGANFGLSQRVVFRHAGEARAA
jgi:putative flippase GtrA